MITDEIISGFKRIRLGKIYYYRKLEEFGEAGNTLLQWLDNGGKVSVREGRGVSLWSDVEGHIKCTDLFHVLARACFLSGIRPVIISMSVLSNEVSGREIDPALEEADAIFLPSFYDESFPFFPFGEDKRKAVEEFIRERLVEGVAVFTCSAKPLPQCDWWSQRLRATLSSSNSEYEVTK